MSKRKCDFQEQLRKWFADAHRIVIAGIGNPIRTDDFVGVKVVRDLRGKVAKQVLLIECETVPESFVQQITDFNPTRILLIDAALMGLKSGSIRIVEPEELISLPAFSTHMLPLRMFCDYLGTTIRARIALLLVEPERTDFGEGLTPKIEATEKAIVETLLFVLKC